MKNEINQEKIKDLIDIHIKVVSDSKEKLVPINVNEKFNSAKQAINNTIHTNMNLPPIKQQINLNKNRNSTAKQIQRDLSIKKKEKEREIIDETTDNKSTKNSFNTTDHSLSFKNCNINQNININKQDTKEQLKIIKEMSPESKICLRNMEIVRKMSEKVKKGREEKIMQLNKPRQSPMERFNNIKKFFQVKSSSGSPRPFDHKKYELYSESNEGNKVTKLFNDNIYYYEIIYGGNSSEVIEECLKRRNQWKLYNRAGEEYTQNFNNIYSPPNNGSYSNNNKSPNNSSFKFNNQAYLSFVNIYNYSYQNENNPLPNFIWSHSSTRLDFSEFSKYRPTHIKKMTNHFEFHKEITNKMNLFLNMMIYCESYNLDLFSMLPMTFPIRYESQNYINEISSFMQIFNNINKYIDTGLNNSEIDLKKNSKYKYRNLFDLELKGRIGYRTPFHIPKTHYCGRNLWLVKAIDLNRGRCIKISDNINGIESIIKHFYKGMKRSFFKMVTKEMIDDEEKDSDKTNCFSKININNSNNEDISDIFDNKNNNNTIHIKYNNNNMKKKDGFKKNINLNKKGKLYNNKIHLPILSTSNNTLIDVNNVNESKKKKKDKSRNFLENRIKNNDNNGNNKIVFTNLAQQKGYQILKQNNPQTYQNSTIIIQKYIEKPLCYNGRKCDMRVWVMLTWDFNLYLFKEGHFKATSLPYDVNSQDSYVHLTNYSVQKSNKNFAKFETGNEISFTDFECSLNNKINVKKDLLPRVRDIIIHSMKSVCGRINKLERKICFEIFGYDFMFDENFNPFLLEVNTNPGLEISSPLIEMLIPRMIDDAFKLTIDRVFILNKANLDKMKENPYKVIGYNDEENMWELLGNIID